MSAPVDRPWSAASPTVDPAVQRRRRWRWPIALGVLLACGSLLAAATVHSAPEEAAMSPDPLRRALTNAMLFYPGPRQDRVPAAVGLAYDEAVLRTDDGLALRAWWVPASDERAPALLFFHGNAGTMADRLENTRWLHGLGLHVLMVEYRGYGGNPGELDETGLFLDATAALREARRRAPSSPVVAFGRSLGGAVAIALAAQHPVDALVVESTFTSLGDMAEATGLPLARHLVAYRLDSLTAIAGLAIPILIVHGDADETVPFTMGQRLHHAARASPHLRLLAVPGGTHNDTWLHGGAPYQQAWRDFVEVVRSRGR